MEVIIDKKTYEVIKNVKDALDVEDLEGKITDYYDNFDYIIGMDTANIRNLNRMLKGDPEGKIYKFLSFAGLGRDIADPWYTGDFDETYEDVMEGCKGFLEYLKSKGQI